MSDSQVKNLSLKEKIMSLQEIIRAWKDPEYRATLSEKQRSQLPKHPAGSVEIFEQELETIAGGAPTAAACKPTQWISACVCST